MKETYTSDYDVRLATLAKLGGDATKNYASVYDIDLEILKLTGQGGGGMTPEEVATLIESYNYTTMAAVEAKNYTTMAAVEAKGYGNVKTRALTQAEYDALPEKDINTLYIITDAE